MTDIIDVNTDTTEDQEVDLFDPETLSALTDREVMECILAYLRDIHTKIDAAEKIITSFSNSLSELSDNPMFRMLGIQLG